jgi:DNA-binding response OmpR family regulator/HPt (histidine-containing phosphotransfer) domain-containing protein
MKILLIEDDESVIALLTKSLTAHRYVVDTVRDGETGWVYGSTFEYDLIVMDIMLPKLDGMALCQRFRAEEYTTPILLLTSQDSSTAKVQGLNAGADDYVIKPFDVEELMARIRALLRRCSAVPSPLMSWGDLLLDPVTCEVTYSGHPLTLTTKEYELIELLLQDSRHILSNDEILDRLWSSDEFPAEATVRSHIRRLRSKLQKAGAPSDFISTLYGRGYSLKAMEPPVAQRSQTASAIAPSPLDFQENREPNQQLQYLEFLNETWTSTQPNCLAQVNLLAQAVQTFHTDLYTEQLQQQAHHIAHKLVGTLGLFGLTQGEYIARRLEDLLSQGESLTSGQRIVLDNLVTMLQQEIQSTHSLKTQATTELVRFPHVDAKIMFVDDDDLWLRTLPPLLEPWRFKVTTLSDPQQFWTVLQSVRPDALVLDIKMPEIDGLELCQILRSDPHWQRLPVLFVSALEDIKTQNKAFTVGADDYLCKPVMGDDLANRILNRLQRIRSWTR